MNPFFPRSSSERRLQEAWRNQAACLGLDDELFFPIGTSPLEAVAAKLVCGTCPVQQQCLAWATQAGVRDGIWGGHTPQERRAASRREREMRVTLGSR